MDSSLHGLRSEPDELEEVNEEDEEFPLDEEEPHIHMPNPSLWPLVLSVAILATMFGFLFVSTAPWIVPIMAVFVLIGILGFAIEDPLAHREDTYLVVPRPLEVASKYKIGQNVLAADGKWLGEVKARFSRYLLVERGAFIPKVYYVPQSAIRDTIKGNTLFLTLSEDDLQRMEANRIPDDLYTDMPEYGRPTVRGAAQFARGPLSPAETGHYNYGPHWPGMNTDASGSYHRVEVTPTPQNYVQGEVYATEERIPARAISPD